MQTAGFTFLVGNNDQDLMVAASCLPTLPWVTSVIGNTLVLNL